MAVSLAVSEIFSVKEWRDLEIWIWDRARSFKMVPFGRSYTTFHLSVIVSMAVSYSISETKQDIS